MLALFVPPALHFQHLHANLLDSVSPLINACTPVSLIPAALAINACLSPRPQISGPQRDLHSGNDGGVFNEPMSDLVKLLARLTDSSSNVLVPGFYDNVAPHLRDLAWSGLGEAESEFSLDGYKRMLGVPELTSPVSADCW